MNKKKIIIGILIAVVLIFSIIIAIILSKPKIELKHDNYVFEFGESVSADPSKYIKNGNNIKDINNYKIILNNKLEIKDKKILSKDQKYLMIGKYNISIKYKKEIKSFSIEVKDTKKPEFKIAPEEITLEQNSKNVDLTKFFEVEDLSKVKLSIDGNYDISKLGNYDLKAIATDEYKNKSEKKFTLKVIDFESSKQEGRVSQTIDGTIYKSEAMIEYENNKNNPAPSSSNNQSTSQNTRKDNTINYNKNSQSSSNTQQTSEGYRRDISNKYASQINAYRRQNGLSELPITTEAQTEADMRAKQLVSNYSHNASYGFGENIGKGTAGGNFFEAWKNSPTHRATMLREQNTAMAVSVYEKDGMWYAVTSFRMNY